MEEFVVIAHRGACGYLPEHTLEGVAMAHAMNVCYIEQDVVLTRDEVLIVLHDPFLEAVSDVASRFPGRARKDGHYYAIDFDLEEIRTLRIGERLNPDGSPEFPGRFPAGENLFRIPTLEEEITLIQGLNQSTGRNVGLYIEPKSPAWHLREGKDLLAEVIQALDTHGYRRREDRAVLQSFDPGTLHRARHEFHSDLTLVQLIGENDWGESEADFDFMRTEKGLAELADQVDGIGPWIPHVIEIENNSVSDISDLVPLAHRFGLFVHAYTLRADQLPLSIGTIADAMVLLQQSACLDGVFSDHPDQVVSYLQAQ